jgi:hypothetical protein
MQELAEGRTKRVSLFLFNSVVRNLRFLRLLR